MGIFKILTDIIKTIVWVVYIILTQAWQVLGILVIAIINNRPWECLFIILGFLTGRMFFDKTYHAPTMFICTILTWLVFYFLTAAVPSFAVSITLPSIFGISLAYALSLISELIERRNSDDG